MVVLLKCMAASVLLKWKYALNRKISVKYMLYIQLMVASTLLRKSVSIEEWFAATTFVK